MWNRCVLDATMGNSNGLFNFCPIEGDLDGDFEIITGMNFIDSAPPKNMKMVAVVHTDGQEAVDCFCAANKAALDSMRNV